MEILPIKTKIFHLNNDLIKFITQHLKLQEKNILVISSKIAALSQGRIKNKEISLKRIIEKEADQVISDSKYALTLKDNIFIPNAGIDQSNSEGGYYILWPEKIQELTDDITSKLKKHFHLKKLGIIVADSYCRPLRNGVAGICLSCSGFYPIIDETKKKDLFGRQLEVTKRNMADMLASGAVAVMGETKESTPLCLIKDAPVKFTSKHLNTQKLMYISPEKCLFAPLYKIM
ncbi:hypothetical protein A2483_03680 [Candidatus Peregrinibacteria bacterium RIFOXYC2_FULL_33_13]|nr:MAG: hypothetical protein UR27_C0016G0013 [Candidatus Peregrinibacteria bacterium GW2011_GWA2_33_10]KKP38481.1 MAG: hypothetical protein UR30_C0018G0008 [Candidatus Peregrinibacteria bacterium GW2011_GWC2_33_13]OGJ50021.1 MAG: hypothetical protein A2229_04240 [Candidatus Peregrinibacteria bacterium RIFOXYA2_FULL_33_7]OGJ54398.1 MAG: hypothetical protein A2483_03680 [Candidatus Peregrinibacteria bacterium RIFOXYC2_FULL_33_13]